MTTNFDRLFEACRENLRIWRRPLLPDPFRPREMDGIIHLHGCATIDYSGADGDGFVLSTADFGRAYLSEAWATEFFRKILARYVVVFVGYTADDPPVQYLLEALNSSGNKLPVYAFQAGFANEVAGKWLHKGVEAIQYDETNKHLALWATLAAWADRAKAPDEWFQSVIESAKRGPAMLEPYERGQVAHVVSKVEGVRKFSECDPPPPAEWLCVFDPFRRYAKPGDAGRFGEEGEFVDPFDLYGLDSDVVPPRVSAQEQYSRPDRSVPSNAWDGLTANRLDRENLRDANFSAIRGHWATHFPRLSPRLGTLAVWIGRVADQPTTVWWAANQHGLHPDIQEQIRWELKRTQKNVSPIIRKAWQYLFEAWGENQRDFDRDWYDLKQTTDKEGWNSAAIRKYAEISRPYLKVESRYWGGPIPQIMTPETRIDDMMRLEVVYADQRDEAAIPDELLSFAVRELRKNLDVALHLETELDGYGLENISPIIPDDGGGDDNDYYMRIQGLSGSVILFASLFERLLKLDSKEAKNEFHSWSANDDTSFARLRIWASGYSDIVPADAFGQVIAELRGAAFWNTYHQRDLLLVLAKRWGDLPKATRKEIETRLLRGRTKWDGEEDNEFEQRRAWAILNRLWWLANNCDFTFDLKAETQRLTTIVPEWTPDVAAEAAASTEARGYSVKTETEHSALLKEPVHTILERALELTGRTDDFHIQNDPFAGLSDEHPVRAFSALRDAARRDQYPEWAWRTFLNHVNDRARLSAVIAERISRFPNQAVAGFIAPASDWLLDRSQDLASASPRTFERIVSKLIDVLRSPNRAAAGDCNNGRDSSTEVSNSSPVPSLLGPGPNQRDWTSEAINAPAGKIARALLNDPRKNGLALRGGFPADWLKHVNDLLSLSARFRCHALVIFAHNLNWFFVVDPDWTDAHLLAVLDRGAEPEKNAIWRGFLWAGKFPHQDLFLKLKPGLLNFAKQRSWPRLQYGQVLAPMILAGWGNTHSETGERLVSNDEMNDVLFYGDDEFRAQILWQMEIWSKNEKDGVGEKWRARIPELLRDVWPRQKSVKTARTSAALCDLAFSNASGFPEIAEAVLPLLTKIDRNRFVPHDLLESNDNIIGKYPQPTLAIFYAVLPDDVADWPYGIGDILRSIGDADVSLRADERLIELNRKWNSR